MDLIEKVWRWWSYLCGAAGLVVLIITAIGFFWNDPTPKSKGRK